MNFFTNHKHARKKLLIFMFHDKVTISDYTPYNITYETGNPTCQATQPVFQV